MLKHVLFLISTGLFSGMLLAQSGPVSAGGDASGSGGSVSYSIGQVDYIHASSSSGSYNQGLQQPYEIFTSGIEDAGKNLGISVYPNPTTDVIYIQFTQLSGECYYQLFNPLGQQVASAVISENPTGISMQNYAAGTYYLKLTGNKTTLQTFTIIKK